MAEPVWIDNGLELAATDEDAIDTMLRVARGELTISELAAWLRRHT